MRTGYGQPLNTISPLSSSSLSCSTSTRGASGRDHDDHRDHDRERKLDRDRQLERDRDRDAPEDDVREPGRPMSRVLAALARADLEYSGIVRPHDDGTYERPSVSPTSASRSAPVSASPQDHDQREREREQELKQERSREHVYLHGHPHGHPHGHEGHHHPLPHLSHGPPPHHNGSGGAPIHQLFHSDDQNRPTLPPVGGHFFIDSKYPPTPAVPPRGAVWDQGYRDDQTSAHPAPPPPPSVSTGSATSEVSKKRRRGAKATTDVPEGAEVEYEDPQGDTTRGPVFVHPPKGAVQACIRCHRIKRKCDGAWPRCTSCTRAEVACVFELSAATSSYVHKLKTTNRDISADLAAAQARVRALEAQVLAARRGGTASHPGSDITPATATPDGRPEFGRLMSSALSIREASSLNAFSQLEGAGPQPARPGSAAPSIISPVITDYLSHADAVKCYKANFAFNEISYPLIYPEDIVPEIHELFGVGEDGTGTAVEGDAERRRVRRGGLDGVHAGSFEDRVERRKFLAWMVLALGRASMERSGDAPPGSGRRLYNAAQRWRAKALDREDILCVQALLLLQIYAMTDPSTGSIWQIIGLAGRVILALGLHRRAEAGVSEKFAEFRRRLFTAFYNIDRLVSATLGRPVTIADEDIDIEELTERPEQGLYRGLKYHEVTNYIKTYRGLIGKVQTMLYGVSSPNNALPEPERRAIMNALRGELDEWVKKAPKPPDEEVVKSVNHVNWFLINYNQALCSLYRPSPMYPQPSAWTSRELYKASSDLVDQYMQLWNVNKVAFHLIHIIGLFVACISLLCCLCECDARMRAADRANDRIAAAKMLTELGLDKYSSADDPAWRDEIRARVKQCQHLFEAFGFTIPVSAKYRDIFSRLSELLLARHGPLENDPATQVTNAATAHGLPTPADEPPAQLPPSVAGSTTGATAPLEPQPAHPIQPLEPTADTASHHSLTAVPTFDNPAGGPMTVPSGDDMAAGAWDAMQQLWYDLGDLFGDATVAPGIDDGWVDQWNNTTDGGWWNQV